MKLGVWMFAKVWRGARFLIMFLFSLADVYSPPLVNWGPHLPKVCRIVTVEMVSGTRRKRFRSGADVP